MDRIAFCESTYNPAAMNGSIVGLYQLAPGGELDNFYKAGYDNPLDPSQQANYVGEQLAKKRLSPWKASENCWNR